ncbi:hypothetical protein AC579_5151 [Pseudocercospora musae]|uniref:Uncharacterized protein n=1 Tax=Pseudocercospora musae TaxID=113226 RepID=A0A139INM0_9PEZI|nr:hypothetical protein AC579_5151 [Pseudocercospora musae]
MQNIPQLGSGLVPQEVTNKLQRLGFVCAIHDKQPERVVAIIQDLRRRATTPFLVNACHFACGDLYFRDMPNMVEIFRLAKERIQHFQKERNRIVAEIEKKRKRLAFMEWSVGLALFSLVPVVVEALALASIRTPQMFGTMSASFFFDIKPPAGYAMNPKTESKVGWFTIMRSASDFKHYSHQTQLSTDTHDQFKTPRLRFGCVVQYPVATKVVGITKDLSERAAKHFDVASARDAGPDNERRIA